LRWLKSMLARIKDRPQSARELCLPSIAATTNSSTEALRGAGDSHWRQRAQHSFIAAGAIGTWLYQHAQSSPDERSIAVCLR